MVRTMAEPDTGRTPPYPPAPGGHAAWTEVAGGPVIVAFGVRPERVTGREGRIDAVPEPPAQEHADVLVEALRAGVEAGGHVVAIVPTWFPEPGVMRLEMARSLLDTDRLAVHRTALPPLAAAVLASLASSCAPHLPSAGVLASLLEPLERSLHSFAWLGSVSGLSAPAPSLGQHLASLTPGSAFAVSSHPEPAVRRVRGEEAGVPLPEIEHPSRLVVSAQEGVDPGWAVRGLAGALGLPVVQVAPTPGGPAWWGTGKLVEAVACRVDDEALAAEILAGAAPWACRWCGELIARSPCPLCGHRARPRRQAGPAQHGART